MQYAGVMELADVVDSKSHSSVVTTSAESLDFSRKLRWTSDFSEAPSGVRLKNINAGVSELADETDSKSVIRKGVWVRVPPPAPEFNGSQTQ